MKLRLPFKTKASEIKEESSREMVFTLADIPQDRGPGMVSTFIKKKTSVPTQDGDGNMVLNLDRQLWLLVQGNPMPGVITEEATKVVELATAIDRQGWTDKEIESYSPELLTQLLTYWSYKADKIQSQGEITQHGHI